MQNALGIMECIGYAPAIAAADSALKAANIKIVGYETVIGLSLKASVAVKIEGEVAAVNAAVAAGEAAAKKVGDVAGVHVIPRPHEQLDKMLIPATAKNNINKETGKKNCNTTKTAAEAAVNKEEVL